MTSQTPSVTDALERLARIANGEGTSCKLHTGRWYGMGDICACGEEQCGYCGSSLTVPYETEVDHELPDMMAIDAGVVSGLIAVARAARDVATMAEVDDNWDGEFVDYLLPATSLDALKAALRALETEL